MPEHDVEHLSTETPPAIERQAMELLTEKLAVSKRVQRTLVNVTRTTETKDYLLEEELFRDLVVVDRVAVGREVQAVPPIRQEGDVTILPVVEEEVVVVRRLVLKEEIHLCRVRITEFHTEVVKLRQQHAAVTRTELEDHWLVNHATLPSKTDSAQKENTMSEEIDTVREETIIAVYDTAAHAEAAVSGLKTAGVPDSAINVHRETGTLPGATAGTVGPVREQGFWANLFGGEPDHDTMVYDRSLEDGATVVSVKVSDSHVAHVTQILESHNPIDIDERSAGYGLTQATTRQPVAMPTAASGIASATTGDKMSLSEESLAVGKRVVNRGGTRIRRFVVETPVEQNVKLHDERVVLERHPVTDGRPVGAGDFSDKTIEMTESAEEAVVSKTAHVYEEVGLRKEATDRTETVRGTVRKEKVEVEKIPGAVATGTVPTGAPTPAARMPKV